MSEFEERAEVVIDLFRDLFDCARTAIRQSFAWLVRNLRWARGRAVERRLLPLRADGNVGGQP